MKSFIINFFIMCLLAFFGWLLDAFLKKRNIDLTYAIYVTIGYLDCLIVNNFFIGD